MSTEVLAVDWGAWIPEVGCEVRRRQRDYLARMADVELVAIDVVVEARPQVGL